MSPRDRCIGAPKGGRGGSTKLTEARCRTDAGSRRKLRANSQQRRSHCAQPSPSYRSGISRPLACNQPTETFCQDGKYPESRLPRTGNAAANAAAGPDKPVSRSAKPLREDAAGGALDDHAPPARTYARLDAQQEQAIVELGRTPFPKMPHFLKLGSNARIGLARCSSPSD